MRLTNGVHAVVLREPFDSELTHVMTHVMTHVENKRFTTSLEPMRGRMT
jgi:hypothetical protein